MVWDVPTVQEVPMGAGAGTQHSADDKEEGGAQGHPHPRAHKCEGRWGQDWAALRYHHRCGWFGGGVREVKGCGRGESTH